MTQVMLAVAMIAQAAIGGMSPLQVEEQELENCSPEVRYEFIRLANPQFGIPLRRYVRLPIDVQMRAAREAYYLSAIDRALLVYQGDPDLIAILNSFANGSDAERVATSFEQVYYSKFGRWPPIVPVNVSALVVRMLDERTVR
ncbi:hypothetical protein QH494_15165 [Sphingomonas sp. AR_OL41]|uniref:hypothetical protein n=1 Tax=Sphingomonas sp. AR_OL41 TaxID=3042729 RepID=UPI0024810E44|nr:hypothetical protein [Sphingomonas sp. AR_OL41]MDH7973529.1 hypothetical protein [Sphingomonas sp. AR_OL41]